MFICAQRRRIKSGSGWVWDFFLAHNRRVPGRVGPKREYVTRLGTLWEGPADLAPLINQREQFYRRTEKILRGYGLEPTPKLMRAVTTRFPRPTPEQVRMGNERFKGSFGWDYYEFSEQRDARKATKQAAGRTDNARSA